MPKRIPIAAAKRIAKDHDCRQVILCAWDGELVHVVTYGRSIEDCDQAAQGGDLVKAALGWPESLQGDLPSRVAKWKKRALDAEAKLETIDQEPR